MKSWHTDISFDNSFAKKVGSHWFNLKMVLVVLLKKQLYSTWVNTKLATLTWSWFSTIVSGLWVKFPGGLSILFLRENVEKVSVVQLSVVISALVYNLNVSCAETTAPKNSEASQTSRAAQQKVLNKEMVPSAGENVKMSSLDGA